MTMIPLLIAAVTSGTAHAGKDDPMGLRIKFSTPVIQNSQTWVDNEDIDDPMKSKSTSISTFDGDNRLELTYLFGDSGVEAGAMLGYNRVTSKTENDETEAEDEQIGLNTNTLFLVTAAYNLKLGGGARLFIQPMAGVDRYKSTNKVGDAPQQTNFLAYGADVGVRLKAFKRASIDFAGEYMGGNGTFVNDEKKDEDNTLKMQNLGIRGGISILL
jgi:hypothetical protein